jgi:uncharacterized DUF497 family protein
VANLRWTWNDDKNKTNKLKHGLGFETAKLVFNDPLADSRRDPVPNEERWQTVGLAGYVIIFVVHTSPEYESENGETIGRIISARKATKYERRAYEEGHF